MLIGQAWGAREPHKVKAIAGTALALGVVLGLVGGAAWRHRSRDGCCRRWARRADVMPDAVGYARVMMLAMPRLLVFILLTQLMRGVGDTVTPLYALLLSTISLVMTPALIRGWWACRSWASPAPRGRIDSPSWCALAFLTWPCAIASMRWRPTCELLRALKINPRDLLQLVIRIGLPTGVQMVVISLAEIVLLALVNGFGSDATAAYGAVTRW